MFKRTTIDETLISTLARSYNILEYHDNLRKIVSYTYKGRNLMQYANKGIHWLINEILLEHYKGESTLKAKLVELFIKKDVTAAFEIKVNRSRVDFLTVNGESRSFEIKSELDNLHKLPKQISDYQRVFDYNYIVIDEKHYSKAVKLIPNHYGVMVLHGHLLTEDKPAELNGRLDPSTQLKLFTKKEFSQSFKTPGITEDEILINFDEKEINSIFKAMLKKRYAKRWNFLVDNKTKIHSIDYQYFFQHNIEPRIIYESSNQKIRL